MKRRREDTMTEGVVEFKWFRIESVFTSS